METFRDLGVTGLIELAARRHPHRAGQACPARASSRSRCKTPDDLDAARTLIKDRTRHDRHLEGLRAGPAALPPPPALLARMTRHRRLPAAPIVPNSELVERIDSSDEWIRERSGIIERRWAGDGESVIDMSLFAARPALEMAGIEGTDLDAIIVATVSYALPDPGAAPLVADGFGDARPWRLDISAACAGYCHGIALANDMVRGGTAEHVLVVGVEKLSDFTDRDDRGTAFIFGDGAGAAVIGPFRDARHRPDDLGLRRREVGGDLADRRAGSTSTSRDSSWPHIGMQGQTVFRWAVWGMAPVAQQALDAAGVTVDQLDAFIPHQANMRIVDAMAKQLKLPGRRRRRA